MANGWTIERRVRQAAMIHTWKPWESSTGPQTSKGKLSSSQNSFTHGGHSQAAKRIDDLLHHCKESLKLIREN